MRQEAEMLQAIRHPNVVGVIGYFVTDHGEMIAMELLQGMAIDQAIKTRGPATHEEAVAAVRQVLSALQLCHDHSIVHRDIKPENIIRVNTPEGPETKLVDFGIAKATELLSDSETGVTLVQTRAGGFMGTPRYAAPEQVVGDPFGPNIDLYAFGLVMAEWLSGRPRMDGETHGAVMAQVLNPSPIDVSDCPYRWREWLALMIIRNPKERIQTAKEALERFEELVIRLHETSPEIVHGFTPRQHIDTPPPAFRSNELVPDFAKVQQVPNTPAAIPIDKPELPPVESLFKTEKRPGEIHIGHYLLAFLAAVIVGVAVLYLLF